MRELKNLQQVSLKEHFFTFSVCDNNRLTLYKINFNNYHNTDEIVDCRQVD